MQDYEKRECGAVTDLNQILARLDELERVANTGFLQGGCAHCQRDMRALTAALRVSLANMHPVGRTITLLEIRNLLCREDTNG